MVENRLKPITRFLKKQISEYKSINKELFIFRKNYVSNCKNNMILRLYLMVVQNVNLALVIFSKMRQKIYLVCSAVFKMKAQN